MKATIRIVLVVFLIAISLWMGLTFWVESTGPPKKLAMTYASKESPWFISLGRKLIM